MVKTGAMTFLEAALEILRHEGKPLHYKDLTERCAREEAADVRRAHARGDDADAAHRGREEGAGEPVRARQTGDLRPAPLSRGDRRGTRGVRQGRRPGGGRRQQVAGR